MRYLLLSDIHGNDAALEAVLHDAGRLGWDRVVFLGDLVGYYPQPERAARMLMELEPYACVLGNHDELLLAMSVGGPVDSAMHDAVSRVLERHLDELSDAALEFIRGFRPLHVDDEWQAVHGALRHPWEYVTTLRVAQENIPLQDRRICFVGHTHVPRVFASVEGDRGPVWRTLELTSERTTYRIPPLARVLFNPGSVGQPRDGLSLASYAVFDEDKGVLEHRRVAYDVASVQRSVREMGYPESLAQRLGAGL